MGEVEFEIFLSMKESVKSCIFVAMLQKIRFLLWPFSWIYGLITYLRNWLFQQEILPSYRIQSPSIVIGNLSTGGTGKTPHTLWLNQWLSQEFKTTIVSRGYGRKKKGFIQATQKSTPEEIGDEPMLYWQKFPETPLFLSEKRKLACEFIDNQLENQVILLDDAFQHRHITAGFRILLTDFSSPFYRDLILPAGNLREPKTGAKRADVLVFTKCPEDLSEKAKNEHINRTVFSAENVFFSRIIYGEQRLISSYEVNNPTEYILVTGIANPKPLVEHLKTLGNVTQITFADHHDFTLSDIQKVRDKMTNFARENCRIISTEKDAVKLEKFRNEKSFQDLPWYIQEMTVQIDRELALKDKIRDYVKATSGKR